MNEKHISHRIELSFNSTGYKGKDIDDVLPDFITERNTSVGLTWYRSVEGPESFTLVIVISVLVAEIAKGFIGELGKDLYQWTKSKLIPLFKKKTYPVGHILVQMNDVGLDYYIELSDDNSREELASFFKDIAYILAQMDASKGSEWVVEFNKENKSWILQPVESRNK
jgi:hypothetical protein